MIKLDFFFSVRQFLLNQRLVLLQIDEKYTDSYYINN